MADAFIYDAVRTPRGKGKATTGSLATVSPVELAAGVLTAVRDRADLDTSLVDDVILGCVEPVKDQAADIARSAALLAGYDEAVPGVQLNRFCASGLEACALAAAKVVSGQADLAVAGGVEMMSRLPMGSSGYPPLADPGIAFPHAMVPQGVAADLLATLRGHSRDDVDLYAVQSQQRAVRAWDDGRFDRGVVPVIDPNGIVLLDRDEAIRADANMQAMGALEPSFALQAAMAGFDAVATQRYPEIERLRYVHHAGNSSAIVDGAAAVLIGDAAAGQALGRKPRARILASVSIGSEPTVMLTGPTAAVAKALARAGLTIADIDLWELNEAFASVVLNFMGENAIDRDRINVNGGAIAMGHPLGATGAMILGTLVDEMERADKQLGVATLCAASGMAIAMVVERV